MVDAIMLIEMTERFITPWNIFSMGLVGIMYLVYLDFGRGDTLGRKFLERMETTVLIGYTPCIQTFESFGEEVVNIMSGVI